MDALKELWWVIVMLGGPVLCVFLWEQYKKYQARKDEHIFKTVEEHNNELD
jgi:hypothetical protein